MNNLFNMDNSFFTTLGKITDVFLISILWVLLSLPIVTIGPATTALYYVVVKVIRRERGYLFREFFKSFRDNFKRGAIVGVMLTLLFGLLIFNITYAWDMLAENYNMGSILLGVYIALVLLITSLAIYAFPILSRFDMSVRQLFKAASFMSVRHLPSTLGMAIIVIVSITFTIMLSPLVFITPGVTALFVSFFMERIFKKYMPKTEGDGEETSKDEWYLE